MLIQRVQSLGQAQGNWVVGAEHARAALRVRLRRRHHWARPGLADDRWQANPTASADTQVRRAANFDVLVRNVYKVLLPRGLVGCVIYSTDPEPRALLTKLGIPAA